MQNDFCFECYVRNSLKQRDTYEPNIIPMPEPLDVYKVQDGSEPKTTSIADKYPQYYKKVNGLTSVDVYAVHQLFNIQDPSGCIQHASKKLLLSGVRTGGKSFLDDIKEARDTLNRYIELQETIP